MTTRDIGNQTQTTSEPATVIHIDGKMYYQRTACDGWPTGPCLSPAKALERVTAYERCEEVSEAAPQQASRAQMQAFLQWARVPLRDPLGVLGLSHRDAESRMNYYRVRAEQAIRDGLHSDAWVSASSEFVSLLPSFPHHVIHAGGTMVRRRLPDTAIPTRGGV